MLDVPFSSIRKICPKDSEEQAKQRRALGYFTSEHWARQGSKRKGAKEKGMLSTAPYGEINILQNH